jgi:hypothetical protein
VFATRAAATAALVAVSASLVSGCSDAESKADPGSPSSSPATLPDNLCDDVLAAVSREWGFAEDTHRTEAPTATCDLTGPAGSSLRVTLTDFPDRDGAAAGLDVVCRTSIGSPVGEGERRCQVASDRVPGQPYAAAYAASYSDPASVVVIELRTTDDTVATLAPGELAGIEAGLQSR